MMQAFAFLLVGVLCSVVGEMLLKHGVSLVSTPAKPLELWPVPVLVETLWRVFTNPFVLGGFISVFAGSIFWLSVLSRLELSVAYPMLSISYVIVVFLSWLIFRENVSLLRFAGVIVIVSGVALIGISYQQDRTAQAMMISQEANISKR